MMHQHPDGSVTIKMTREDIDNLSPFVKAVLKDLADIFDFERESAGEGI